MSSIGFKLILVFIVLLSGFLGFLYLANSLFLEDYYVFRNKPLFEEAYHLVLTHKPATQEDFLLLFRTRSNDIGLKVMMTTGQGRIKFSSSPEYTKSKSLDLPKEQIDYLREQKKNLETGTILYGKLHKNSGGSSIVQLVAYIDNKDYLVITSPLNPIRENAKIALDFFLILVLGILIIGVPLILILSNRMIRPLKKLTQLAFSIAHLDFSGTYQSKSTDEIGQLGQSMNRISVELHQTLEKLRISNDQLKEEMTVQKRFFASISHDFKTPVGLIRGYAESIELGLVKSEPEKKALAHQIVTETDRLNNFVNDILFMLRMDSVSISLKKETLTVQDLLDKTIDRFSKELKAKAIELHVDMDTTFTLAADRNKLLRVFDSLLDNAIRHTEKNGTISVTALKNDEEVYFEICNTGKPIPSLHLPHIFNPFYRVDDDRNRRHGGSGLGLAIVKGIINAHGSDTGVKNMPPGVVFWFTIPDKS